MKKTLFRLFPLLVLTFTCQGLLTAQAAPLKPVNFGDTMPDFTLTSVQGADITLSALKGKNVLIIFPRGRVGDHWCQICHYQYAELADLEKVQQIRKKFNLEILFVLPYDKTTVEHWVSIFPEQMTVIDGWKNPPAEAQKDPGTMRWMETSRRLFPIKFAMSKDNIPTPFPILIDAERKLSEGLQLFTLFWDRSYVEQNIATVFLLDKDGIVRFKYFSQSTVDRPDAAFLLKCIECMLYAQQGTSRGSTTVKKIDGDATAGVIQFGEKTIMTTNKTYQAADLAAIEKLHRTDMAAAKIHDIKTLITLWTDDGILFLPGQEPIRGKVAIWKYLQEQLPESQKYEITEYLHVFEEVQVLGNWAYEWATFTGTFRLKSGGPDLHERARLFRVLRRQPDGSWLGHRAFAQNMPEDRDHHKDPVSR